MTTDLTRRARTSAATATGEAAALLTGLADEVDRLMLIAERSPTDCDEVLRLRAALAACEAERDAAYREEREVTRGR